MPRFSKSELFGVLLSSLFVLCLVLCIVGYIVRGEGYQYHLAMGMTRVEVVKRFGPSSPELSDGDKDAFFYGTSFLNVVKLEFDNEGKVSEVSITSPD